MLALMISDLQQMTSEARLHFKKYLCLNNVSFHVNFHQNQSINVVRIKFLTFILNCDQEGTREIITCSLTLAKRLIFQYNQIFLGWTEYLL